VESQTEPIADCTDHAFGTMNRLEGTKGYFTHIDICESRSHERLRASFGRAAHEQATVSASIKT
jgi:hypothetical protein